MGIGSIPRSLAPVVLVLAAAALPACASAPMSHPPMARADVQTTDPGAWRTIAKVQSPISALVTLTESGVDATGAETAATKVGRSTCRNILGLVAFGDATVQEAAREGGITTIHHVDAESTRIWFFYSQYTTVVYGE
jgi:type IV pilus biogenesis protein CpaD/CtpE